MTYLILCGILAAFICFPAVRLVVGIGLAALILGGVYLTHALTIPQRHSHRVAERIE